MACKTVVMQGDAYNLYFKIKLDGDYINIEDVDKIEFIVGNLKKLYPSVITYDSENQVFRFPLSQHETINMMGEQNVQVRIKLTNGGVYGKKYGSIRLQYSESEVIL